MKIVLRCTQSKSVLKIPFLSFQKQDDIKLSERTIYTVIAYVLCNGLTSVFPIKYIMIWFSITDGLIFNILQILTHISIPLMSLSCSLCYFTFYGVYGKVKEVRYQQNCNSRSCHYFQSSGSGLTSSTLELETTENIVDS